MTNKNEMLKWVVWILVAFFYFYEYLLRVSPSVMVSELMGAFNIDAALLGLLVSFYFYAYAPMQLPVGLLIDRFGPKRLLIFSALICGIGSILFGISSRFLEASLGRLMLGFGSSFAFVAMVYVSSHWFPKSKRAMLIGLANSIGMLGAFCGQGPLGIALHKINWRLAMILLGVLGFLFAFLIYFIAKTDKPHPSHKTITKTLFTGLKTICRCRYTWINGITALLVFVITSAIADLWGVPFLQSAYKLSEESAGFAISMIFLGWLVGGPLIGFLSDKIRKRKKLIIICIILTIFSLVPAIYYPHIPLPILYGILFCVGFFSAGELLHYTLIIEQHSPHVKGSIIAFTNCIISFGSALIQPIIGVFLDMTWDGTKENGVDIYSARNYQDAFLILPIFLCLALLLSFFLKEASPTEHAVESLNTD